eukprot:CAMPEP_0175081190 /NCGR_PEP_ID=MMETSP0052_2-20121109/25985_1 /TAXON_ID=51329 ORGANISM="Polytomella parva, Strain SAG 63-3" /NCGR_SAMPLE_ID=MMETSP0052_2 /ASSEMBLY_ACC=CAM_ASM_000194 /LENGTH=346 /DNA_ID=CAMNT_0016352093 /DNA_START=118 /DNA_END=1158 /DNA_ORIENTATION=+
MSVARAYSNKALVFDAHGEPLDALKLADQPSFSEPLKAGHSRVRFLLAPINPSDINTVQGKYPLKPNVPGAVPGHEGVAEVLESAPADAGASAPFAPGDRVVLVEPCGGSWRSTAELSNTSLHKIPSTLPLTIAATLCINPPSAMEMLELFVPLQPGDSVVQNGGTSAVAMYVSQLARQKGVKVISVIRERPSWDDDVARLKALGADLVTTDDRLKDDLKASGLPAPALALNCVGGASAVALAKSLKSSGTMVTYGGMSLQPVSIPTSLFIFKDLKFAGYWLSGKAAAARGPAARREVLDRLVDLFLKGELTDLPHKTFKLQDWRAAMEESQQPRRPYKVLLDPQE